MYYNDTKAGVDALDEKCATYFTLLKIHRCPMALFHGILHFYGIDSSVLYEFAK